MSDNKALKLNFINTYHPNSQINIIIKEQLDMYHLKKRLLSYFDKKVRKTITDFRLVDKNEEIKHNYFDAQYNNEEAYHLMKEIKERSSSDFIYFKTIKLTISTTLIDSKKEIPIEIPLAYENSYDQLKNNIQKQIKDKKLTEVTFHVFEDHENKLKKISEYVDMKQYQKLKVYLFPIQARFSFNSTSKTMLLKYNYPLKDYLQKINKKLKANFNENDFLFQVQKADKTFDTIDLKTNIHEILKKQDEEPVVIEILDKSPKKVHIKIPLQNNDFTSISYIYNNKNFQISDLIKELKKYFNISKTKIILLTDDKKEVESNNFVRDFQSLILNYDLQHPLKMTRKFNINGKKEDKIILPGNKVRSIIKDLAYELNSHKSLIKLKLDKTVLEASKSFGSYFIPPQKEINVEIEAFKFKIKLNFIGIKKDEIEAGFVPKMKLISLKESLIYTNDDLKNYHNIFFFFNNEKLDEKKSFEQLGIKDNETIYVYVTKYYLYKFNNKLYPLPSNTKLEEIKAKLNSKFKLKVDEYFIDFNGKPDKNGFSTSLENGKILELKKPRTMKFKIDKKYDITKPSTSQVKEIIAELSKEYKVPVDKIQLFNDVYKELRSDSYLYSSFAEQEEDYTYSIISKIARSYTFFTPAGKFLNETFLPTTKIGCALEELRKISKTSIGEKSIVTYQGRVIDQNSTFNNIINDNNEDDEENPFEIIDEEPPMIKIKFTFQLGKDNEEPIQDLECNNFINPTTALDIRYWASQFCGEKIDNISLISNGEMLNDDEIIDKDTDVIAKPNLQQENENAILEITKTLAKTVAIQENDISKTQRIDQKKFKKAVESSDESELEYFDEEEEEDIRKKSNGTYEPSPNGPEDEYIFKFKIINGDELPIQLPCDATVMDAKEKIAEIRETDIENITIFLGNQRLADFNKFTNLKIPKEVKAFSIKIIDLQDTIVCTRTRLKKTHK